MATSFRSFYHTATIKANTDVLAQTTNGTFITINTTPPIVSGSRLHYSKDTPYVLKASVTNSNAEGLYLFLGGLGWVYNLKLACSYLWTKF
jgi:hypothetical protein